MITASNILCDWWKNQPGSAKVAALSAFIVGMCTHVTAMTNFFLNHDSVHQFADMNREFISNGRWFLGFVYRLHGDSLNQTMGILFEILFISIAGLITVKKLNTRSSMFAALIGAMMVTFPTVVGINAYGVGLPYFLALLLAVLAVNMVDKRIAGTIFSVIALTISMGIYQAFIGYAVGLFVVALLMQALRDGMDSSKIFKKGIKYVFVSLVSCILYFIIVQLIVHMTGEELASYRGMDTALSSVSLDSIPQLVLDAYAGVAKFFLLDAYADASILSVWLYRAVIIFLIFNIFTLIRKRKIYRKKQLFSMIIFLLAVLPLAVHIIVILGQNDSHWLMKYSFVLIPILTIELFDELEVNIAFQKFIVANKKWVRNGVIIFTAIPFILGVGLNVSWFRTTAECYNILRFGNMTALSAATQLCSSLNEAGYTSESPCRPRCSRHK